MDKRIRIKPLTVIFNQTRHIRKINKKWNIPAKVISLNEVNVMTYLEYKGPAGIRCLNDRFGYKHLVQNYIPNLLKVDFIIIENKIHSITFRGLQYLIEYSNMLDRGRLDRIK